MKMFQFWKLLFPMLLLMLVFPFTAQSQSQDAMSGEDMVDSLSRLFLKYIYSDQDSSRFVIDKAYEIADSIGYAEGKVRATRNKGISAHIRGEYIESLKHYFDAVRAVKSVLSDELSKEDNRRIEFLLFDSYGGIGNTYNYMGEFKLALKYYRKAREIAEKYEDIGKVTLVDFNSAIIYQELGNLELAEEIFLESIGTTHNDATNNADYNAYLNLSSLYMVREDFEESRRYCDLALEGFEKIDDQVGVAGVLLNIAEIYYRTGDFVNAKATGFRALEVNEEVGSNNSMVNIYNVIGSSYMDLDSNKLAEEYLWKSLDLCIDKELADQALSACEELTKLYEKTDNTKQLFKIKEIHLEFQNKLLAQKDEFSVEELRIAKSIDKKIESFEMEASIFKRSQLVMLIIVIILGVELLITGYIYSRNRSIA